MNSLVVFVWLACMQQTFPNPEVMEHLTAEQRTVLKRYGMNKCGVVQISLACARRLEEINNWPILCWGSEI